MATNRQTLFIALGSLTFILSWAIYANISFLQILVGLPYILLLPGYLLLHTLSVHQDLNKVQILSLSFGMSIVLFGLLGLGLNYTPWGLQPLPVYISLAILVFGLAAVAPVEKVPTISRRSIRNDIVQLAGFWNQMDLLRRTTLVISVLSIMGTASLVSWHLATIRPGEKFTEFYVLGQNHQADSVSLQVKAGQINEIVLGVINQEQKEQEYLYEILVAESIVYSSNPFALQNGQQYEWKYQLDLPESARNREITFRLFKLGIAGPYRILQIREGELTQIIGNE